MGKIEILLDKTRRKGETKKWKMYVVVIVGFFIMSLVLSPFIYVGIKTGETIDYDSIIAQQRDSDVQNLVGMAYNQQTIYLKIENTNYYHPEILALGTSRIMQMKATYFDTSFYNAGGGANNINEYQNFIENIHNDSYPEILLINLDWDFFNDKWNGELTPLHYEIAKLDMSPLHTRNLVFGFFNNKWTFTDVINQNEHMIGLLADSKHEGFMKDGSYYYGYIYENPSSSSDYQFKDTFNRINTGTNRFEYAEDVDVEALAYLMDLLEYCSKKRIHVIAILPPFAPSVIEMMTSFESKYAYLDKIYPECKVIFDKYEYELYNYTDIRYLGCDDSYFIDGFHGGDVAYLAILIDMIKSGSKLQEYTNLSNLQKMYDNRYSNMTLSSYKWIGEVA